MRQEELDGLAVFLTVAETLSFSQAAVQLGVSASAVSQTIRALEGRLGVTLFSRTTRSVSLTEAGQSYLLRVGPPLRAVVAAGEVVSAQAAQPVGTLRLNMPRAAALIVVRPALPGFLARYPHLKVEVAMQNELVDIVAGGFDAGIRLGDVVAQDMVAVAVGPPLSVQVVASPAYLAQRGVPGHPRDLLAHDTIGYREPTSGQMQRWSFAKDGEPVAVLPESRLVFNDVTALVLSALDGHGIAYVINGYIEELLRDGRLVRLLADWSPPLPGFTLYYPRSHVPQKLRVLIDHLRRQRDHAIVADSMLPLIHAGEPD